MILPDYKSFVDYTKDKDIVYIANCMGETIFGYDVDKTTFNLLCDFAFEVGRDIINSFNNVVLDYQRVCDIVADLYLDFQWGYRNEDRTTKIESFETGTKIIPVPNVLNYEDLEKQNDIKVKMVSELYFNTIYD